MTLYSPKYQQLLQGVSRQDQALRGEGQMQEQFNCISDLVQGLRRRPRFKMLEESVLHHNAEIFDETPYTCWMYERGDGIEAYIIVIDANGGWQVYDAYTGAEVETAQYTTGSIHDYMTTTDPRKNLGFCTVGDKTFLVNRTVEITAGTSTEFDAQPGILIWCKKWSYGKEIVIKHAGGTMATVPAVDTVTITTTTTDKTLDMNSDSLAAEIASQLSTANYYTKQLGSVVWVPGDGRSGTSSAIDEWWSIDDGSNGNDVVVVTGSVNTVEDLPPFAPHEFSVKVEGLGDADFDDFYVRFENSAGDNWLTMNQKLGKWVECSNPAEYNNFDNYTMPLQIVRNFSAGVPYFSMTAASWESRQAGDSTTNPYPTFVGNTINDLFIYKNRLWILSGENACATRAFNYLNWWAASAAAPSDEDPVDTSSSDNTITNLLYGVVNNKDLMIFSNKTQFIWYGEQDVKPKTFSLEVATKYPTDPMIKPVAFGDSVICPTDAGDHVIVWEYTKDPLSGLPLAEDITKHIGNYITNTPRINPKFVTQHEFPGIESIAAHANKGILFMTIGGDIYVLQESKKNKERVQLAWHHWSLAPMSGYSGWWSISGYTEHPTVSDVFVVGSKLIALSRMDSAISPYYNPRFIQLDLDLEVSTQPEPEVFMDFSFDSYGVYTDGPYEYNGEFYDCYAMLPYYYFPDDDDAPTGYEQEAYFDSVLIGDVSPATAGEDTTIPQGMALPYGYELDTTDDLPKLYFNIPSTWLASEDTFDLRLGCKYDSYFTLSQPYVKDQRNKVYTEETVIDDVVMDNGVIGSVYWEADVENFAGEDYTHTFNGMVLNDFRYNLGQINHVTRQEPVAICNERDLCQVTIRSAMSLYGFGFSGCTWHVNMHSNGRRV